MPQQGVSERARHRAWLAGAIWQKSFVCFGVFLGLLWGGFTCLTQPTQEPDKHYPQPLSATNHRRRNRPWCLEQLNLSSALGLGLPAQPTRDRFGWPAIPEWRELHSPLSDQCELGWPAPWRATPKRRTGGGMLGHQCPARVCWRNYKCQSCCEHAQKVVHNPSSRDSLTARTMIRTVGHLTKCPLVQFKPTPSSASSCLMYGMNGPGWPALM
eukprot:2014328-Amphidinium_carterae.2